MSISVSLPSNGCWRAWQRYKQHDELHPLFFTADLFTAELWRCMRAYSAYLTVMGNKFVSVQAGHNLELHSQIKIWSLGSWMHIEAVWNSLCFLTWGETEKRDKYFAGWAKRCICMCNSCDYTRPHIPQYRVLSFNHVHQEVWLHLLYICVPQLSASIPYHLEAVSWWMSLWYCYQAPEVSLSCST